MRRSHARQGLRGRGCGPQGSRGSLPSLSLPGLGGWDAVALTYRREAEDRGGGAAPRSLLPPPEVSSASTARSRSCSRDCGGDCAGASRGWARRTLERGRRAAGRRTKPPFFPPRPALPRGCPRPRTGNAGGSGRSRDPLPSLRRFPAAAAARARTREVGQRPGDEKLKTWSREGGRARRARG